MTVNSDTDITVTIPKGTILHYRGFPCELTEDTPVVSAMVASMGLAGIDATFGLRVKEPEDTV